MYFCIRTANYITICIKEWNIDNAVSLQIQKTANAADIITNTRNILAPNIVDFGNFSSAAFFSAVRRLIATLSFDGLHAFPD